jgi:hypothetical protein
MWKSILHHKGSRLNRYPVFIDAVVQGGAHGFLGTQGSTMSLLAVRRVEDWQGGIGRMVQWNLHNMNPDAIKVNRRDFSE